MITITWNDEPFRTVNTAREAIETLGEFQDGRAQAWSEDHEDITDRLDNLAEQEIEPTIEAEVRAKINDAETSSIDITVLFDQDNWDNCLGPLAEETLDALGLTDVSRDARWARAFQGGTALGLYRDEIGRYWAANDEPWRKGTALDYVGSEADALAKYGDQD